MAWTAAASNQERSCGQSPRFPGKTPQELPIASPLPWKTRPRPVPAFASRLPSTSVRNSSSSGNVNNFPRLPETAVRMAETFSSASAAIPCFSKPAQPRRKPFLHPQSRRLSLNLPPHRLAQCSRPRPVSPLRAPSLRGQLPSPISPIQPLAFLCLALPRTTLRSPPCVPPIRLDEPSPNPQARPRGPKGRLCSPKDSFPISGASKSNPSRPKPFHHPRRLL